MRMESTGPGRSGSSLSYRWLARAAFVAVAAAFAVPVLVAGLRGSVAMLLITVGCLVATVAAIWWFLTNAGVLRWLAAVLLLGAPAAVLVVFASHRLVWVAAVSAGLLMLAGGLGRRALTRATRAPREFLVPPPRRPFLIMNPRSGGGKVGRFDLVRRAEALGAEVAVLDGSAVDVEALARDAVRRGADLLGVAGGDGTQAIVAGVAAAYDLPFLVISAGTRNHFALDLGLDRDDPATCLDALTDGVEVRVDLGAIGGRTFVNNASFGVYAAIVQSDAYRADKAGTALALLPDLLAAHSGPRLCLRVGDTVCPAPQAILVSNNPYTVDDVAGLGHRPRLDRGKLGVLALTVDSTLDAVRLLRGRDSASVTLLTAREAVVSADAAEVPVGVDGEALLLPAPLRCRIRPAALRVRVPRHRPGAPAARAALDWVALIRTALPFGNRDNP
ncbi:diacylglycerol kinase family protein [Asanoa sp. WMMD1127]|uniref:diacylglycerol/lipid kinase family protein n=1 Tax=Asanoa sp. WMMD1127 TaxID=3016107 RepID=UPI002415A93C|nr:diacylglycerol kinase family protein [Asanoa sp. WMMD1127]MDG4825878.1 diacylglycerol kinase family protein [Asanoa sp. WMMD1127]